MFSLNIIFLVTQHLYILNLKKNCVGLENIWYEIKPWSM